MKVIFRSNDHFAKKSLRNNADVWVESLEKYLSEAAILRLDLFVNQNNVAKASLNIVDKDLHIYASHEDTSFSVALESVVEKCAKQIVKKQVTSGYYETIRYNDEFNVSFKDIDEYLEDNESLENDEIIDLAFELVNMKKSSKYNRIMNKFASYYDRRYRIEQANEHLRILYFEYDNIDEEKMTIADYKRLCASILELEKEVTKLSKKQTTFENSVKVQEYINDVYEKEAAYAKIKSMK